MQLLLESEVFRSATSPCLRNFDVGATAESAYNTHTKLRGLGPLQQIPRRQRRAFLKGLVLVRGLPVRPKRRRNRY